MSTLQSLFYVLLCLEVISLIITDKKVIIYILLKMFLQIHLTVYLYLIKKESVINYEKNLLYKHKNIFKYPKKIFYDVNQQNKCYDTNVELNN
jgi:hypothetical protein